MNKATKKVSIEDIVDEITNTAKEIASRGRFGLLLFNVDEMNEGTLPNVLWVRGSHMTVEEFSGFLQRILSEQRSDIFNEQIHYPKELKDTVVNEYYR